MVTIHLIIKVFHLGEVLYQIKDIGVDWLITVPENVTKVKTVFLKFATVKVKNIHVYHVIRQIRYKARREAQKVEKLKNDNIHRCVLVTKHEIYGLTQLY